MNEFWARNYYENPPYAEGTVVKQFTLAKDTEFVRVYNSEIPDANKGGQFVMQLKDIQNSDGSLMTAEQIKDKFALQYTPDTLQSALINGGIIMDCGIAGPIGWGNGSCILFDLHNVKTGVFTDIQKL